ncbi:hypothetical protein [Pseudomonas veronii]|jgi:hypothetical protein|uniref:hypothetical protein n=1 Tax=Pseudomonas veronii TaxID=76761 RepID=UPI001CC1F052|nr:hypothetical protein [Pseudomonas veronii]
MRDINTFLPFWEGFSVVTIKPDGDALQIDLTPHATRLPICGGCQKPAQQLMSIASESFVICPFWVVRYASTFCSGGLAALTVANAWRQSVGWIAMRA